MNVILAMDCASQSVQMMEMLAQTMAGVSLSIVATLLWSVLMERRAILLTDVQLRVMMARNALLILGTPPRRFANMNP
jgi:hypothetical protein